MIAALADSEAAAEPVWRVRGRAAQAAGWSHLLRESGRYPLTGHGDINTYAVFAETARTVIIRHWSHPAWSCPRASPPTRQRPFFRDLVRIASVACVWTSRMRQRLLPAVHNQFASACSPSLAVASSIEHDPPCLQAPSSAAGSDAKRFTLPPEDILSSTRTPGLAQCFDTPRTPRSPSASTSASPSSGATNPRRTPGACRFMAMFHMANDSGLFRTRDQLERDGWPLDRQRLRPRGVSACFRSMRRR